MKIGYVIASHEVTQHGKRVGRLYREEPDGPADSGWRVFSGEESQAYADDAGNFSLYNASTIVDLDKDVLPLLAAEAPVEFERDPDSGTFVRVQEEGEEE